jgi:hypothetical protein
MGRPDAKKPPFGGSFTIQDETGSALARLGVPGYFSAGAL